MKKKKNPRTFIPFLEIMICLVARQVKDFLANLLCEGETFSPVCVCNCVYVICISVFFLKNLFLAHEEPNSVSNCIRSLTILNLLAGRLWVDGDDTGYFLIGLRKVPKKSKK